MNILSEQIIEYLENELRINHSRIEKIINEIKTKEKELDISQQTHDLQIEIEELKSKLRLLCMDSENYTQQIDYEKKRIEQRDKNLKVIETYFDF